MKTKLISMLLLPVLALAFPLAGWGGAFLPPGHPAPPFLVTSGNDQTLTLDMVRGKVIVLFYESRDVIRKNIDLKNALKALYRSQPAEVRNRIFRLVVVDASEASWLTRGVWRSKLQEHSRKEGFPIYGDWTRRMFMDYRMEPGDSNFLVIDQQGIIRYSVSGKVDQGQFERIENLLKNLVGEA